MATEAKLLYDDCCRFCRWTLGWILRRDRRREIVPVSFASEEGSALLSQLPPDRRTTTWHIVVDGRLVSGGAGLQVVAELLFGAVPGIRLGRRLTPVLEWGYELVARNRSRLSKMLSDERVAKADALIEARSRPAGA